MSDTSKEEFIGKNRIERFYKGEKDCDWGASPIDVTLAVSAGADWQDNFVEAMQMFSAMMSERGQLLAMVQHVVGELREVKNRIGLLEKCHAAHFVIASFAPEPFALSKSIPVAVVCDGEDYTACFSDANIATTGDSEEEAVANLKALILDTFVSLEEEEDNLGSGPRQQLATLRDFLQRQR